MRVRRHAVAHHSKPVGGNRDVVERAPDNKGYTIARVYAGRAQADEHILCVSVQWATAAVPGGHRSVVLLVSVP